MGLVFFLTERKVNIPSSLGHPHPVLRQRPFGHIIPLAAVIYRIVC